MPTWPASHLFTKGPLSQCPQDPGVGKCVRGHRRQPALRKPDHCPYHLQAWAPGHVQTPPGEIQGWSCLMFLSLQAQAQALGFHDSLELLLPREPSKLHHLFIQ